MPWVLVPALAAAKPEPLETAFPCGFDALLILRLTRPRVTGAECRVITLAHAGDSTWKCDNPATRHMRPATKFLTVVWGQTYIERFAALALPSLLAQGNLPALASTTDLEVIILTTRQDIATFRAHRALRRLERICPVRFIEIDDLVGTPVYAVTLTLAYARAIIACGQAMLDTHFVFMNADFVAADGSLRALGRHIEAGRSIVLTTSIRVTAEELEPALTARADAQDGILAVPPRELTALAFSHLHPTMDAKIVNQGAVHSTHANQFFWRAGDDAIVGRCYLLFMLCLRPERIITTINSFCDYAFVPELCPSGDEAVVDASDGFFMLELQARRHERQLLRAGQRAEGAIARDLQRWTTAEHRRGARHDIVFRTGETTPRLEAVRKEAAAFIERIDARLGAPVAHANHRYWLRAVAAWTALRTQQGLTAAPPELAKITRAENGVRGIAGGLTARFDAWWYPARQALFGQAPHVTRLHPDWRGYRALREAIARLAAARGETLIVRDRADRVDPLLGGAARTARRIGVDDLLEGRVPATEAHVHGYAHVLIYLQQPECAHLETLRDRCECIMAPEGACTILVHDIPEPGALAEMSSGCRARAQTARGAGPLRTTVAYVGGGLLRPARALLSRLASQHEQLGPLALLWAVPAAGVLLPIVFILNVRRPG
jgi:hypothetical protein